MERILCVWVEALSEESPDGSTLREYLTLFDALCVLCPFTEAIHLGLYALPVRGPSRFFGGEPAVLDAVRRCANDVLGKEPSLGVADGLFCAELAAREGVVVPIGASDEFRRAKPLEALGRKDLATTCHRLGLHTVGAFADLDTARVAERFDRHALVLHRVARGAVGELTDQRDPRLAARLDRLRGASARDEQAGFFGQRGAGDDRAAAAAHRVRRRLGVDSILVASRRGGRNPQDRATLVPWGSPEHARRDDAPWPGQLRAPSPATTLRRPVAVGLRDASDAPIHVGSRGFLSAAPAALVFTNRARHDVVWFAGPWPTLERWWSVSRRRAHLQVVLATGEAVLLVAESHKWWLVGVYD